MKKRITSILLILVLVSSAWAQLLPVRNDNLWGYADTKGHLKISYLYHDANFFSENLGRVRQNGLYGFIDLEGNLVIKNIYINASDFTDGFSLVTDTNYQQYFINTKGEQAIQVPEGIAFVEPFVNGYSKISKLYIQKRTTVEEPRYHMGFMNTQGIIVVEPKYDDVSDFDKQGISRVVLDKKMGVINTQSLEIVKPQYIYIGPFVDDIAIFQKGDHYGYLNSKGKVIIKPRFDNAGDFGDGFAPIMVDSLWGFIDTKGKVVIKPKYDYAESFSEGMAGVVLNRKWGMIDTKGDMLIRNIFQDYAPFCEGLAAVKMKDLWGYIDKTGNLVVMPQYNIVGSFKDKVSLVENDENAIYINQNGTPIFSYNVKKLKIQDKKKEYYWNNVERKYEAEAQEYIKNKKANQKK
jgi:hypothetical protein